MRFPPWLAQSAHCIASTGGLPGATLVLALIVVVCVIAVSALGAGVANRPNKYLKSAVPTAVPRRMVVC